jgi:hypothetical protein
MEQMSHDQVAADIATQISENALSGATAGANVLTSVAGLVPAGAEEVSAQAATAFAAEGLQMLAVSTAAQEELNRTGGALHGVARTYTHVDDRAASVLA